MEHMIEEYAGVIMGIIVTYSMLAILLIHMAKQL